MKLHRQQNDRRFTCYLRGGPFQTFNVSPSTMGFECNLPLKLIWDATCVGRSSGADRQVPHCDRDWIFLCNSDHD